MYIYLFVQHTNIPQRGMWKKIAAKKKIRFSSPVFFSRFSFQRINLISFSRKWFALCVALIGILIRPSFHCVQIENLNREFGNSAINLILIVEMVERFLKKKKKLCNIFMLYNSSNTIIERFIIFIVLCYWASSYHSLNDSIFRLNF